MSGKALLSAGAEKEQARKLISLVQRSKTVKAMHGTCVEICTRRQQQTAEDASTGGHDLKRETRRTEPNFQHGNHEDTR